MYCIRRFHGAAAPRQWGHVSWEEPKNDARDGSTITGTFILSLFRIANCARFCFSPPWEDVLSRPRSHSTMGQNQVILRHLILHFSTSSGVSEVIKQANKRIDERVAQYLHPNSVLFCPTVGGRKDDQKRVFIIPFCRSLSLFLAVRFLMYLLQFHFDRLCQAGIILFFFRALANLDFRNDFPFFPSRWLKLSMSVGGRLPSASGIWHPFPWYFILCTYWMANTTTKP